VGSNPTLSAISIVPFKNAYLTTLLLRATVFTAFEPGGVVIGIYLRTKNDDGKWRYSKVEEGVGKRTSLLKPPFYARPTINGKQVWQLLHAINFNDAKDEAEHLGVGLQAQAKGMTVAELDVLSNAHRLPLKAVVEIYLELKKSKAKKTLQQYRLTLEEFVTILAERRIRFLDAVTVEALRFYKDAMIEKGYASKTLATRINIVYFMLKKNGVEARVPHDELPAVETENAIPYTQHELDKLFAAMSSEEKERYSFFLGTAARSQEVQFASWQDIDFNKNEFHVRRKLDVGFYPKSHESRTVPLPKTLVAMLTSRRGKMQGTRWIFGTTDKDGDEVPGNHFLRKLKGIALRAKLNCGRCKTVLTKGEGPRRRQVTVSCKTDAVCEHFYLHRFRKTCASRWSDAGIPVRTIQAYLGHKSLETTQLYLGVTDNAQSRANIDKAFGD
jgi:integrase